MNLKRPPLTRGLDFAKQKTGGENDYPSVKNQIDF